MKSGILSDLNIKKSMQTELYCMLFILNTKKGLNETLKDKACTTPCYTKKADSVVKNTIKTVLDHQTKELSNKVETKYRIDKRGTPNWIGIDTEINHEASYSYIPNETTNLVLLYSKA